MKILKRTFEIIGIGFATAAAVLSLNSCKVVTDKPSGPITPIHVVPDDPITQPDTPITQPDNPVTQPDDPITQPDVKTPEQIAEENALGFIANLQTNNFKLTSGDKTFLIDGTKVVNNGAVFEPTTAGVNVYTPNDDETYSKETTTDTKYATVDSYIGSIYTLKDRISYMSFDGENTYFSLGERVFTYTQEDDVYTINYASKTYSFEDFGEVSIVIPTNIKEAEDPVITPVDGDYVIRDGKINVEEVKSVLTEWIEGDSMIQTKVSGLAGIKFVNVEDNKFKAYYVSSENGEKRFDSFVINVDEINNIFANKTTTTKEQLKTKLSSVARKYVVSSNIITIDTSVSDEDVKTRAENILSENGINSQAVEVFESKKVGSSLEFGQGMFYYTYMLLDDGSLIGYNISTLTKDDVKNNTNKWKSTKVVQLKSLDNTEEKTL